MAEAPSNKETLRKFFQMLKPYRWLLLAALLTVLIVESITIVERYLLKVLVDNGTAFSSGSITRQVFMGILAGIAIAFLASQLVKATMRFCRWTAVDRLEANVMTDVKRKYFMHVVHLPHKFHTTHKTGSLISRITRGARALESMMDVIVINMAPIVMQLTVAVVALVTLSLSAAIVIFVTVLVFVLFGMYRQQKQLPDSLRFNEADDYEKGQIADVLTNIESVKYYGKEKLVDRVYRRASEDTKKKAIKSWDWYSGTDAGQTVIIAIGTFFVVYFPAKELLAGTITIGTLVFIYTVFLGLIAPMNSFVGGMRQWYQSRADLASLLQYDDEKNDIEDKPDAKPLHVTKGEITFANVTFGYVPNRKVLKKFNLTIHPNEKVALVGQSGSGKSTLIKLIYRFYDVDAGEVTIDGHDVRDVQQEALRSELAIVPQEAILFDETIYNNILFSRPGASREEVLAAIRFAQLDKVIAHFPEKENTIVGERGIKLSGGEKQRVSIARAILANKRILVLDEATSALDSQTEHDIQADLKKLMQGRTAIIIAHRLSTIMSADRIVVLDEGNIVQMGTHNELIRQKGLYKKLWDLQKGGYIQ